MARPLRIEYPGAVYHVINRGNQRQRVFHSVRYYGLFLEKLAKFSETFKVRIRAYCLMPNHFHLYVETVEANLSRFMQSFLTSYCIVANKWRRNSGHIFQGRFKSQLVQDELYGSRVSRYIHLNPVRTKRLETSTIEERLKVLNEFRWSSYQALTGFCSAPEWMDAEATLCRWGQTESEQFRNYGAYVQEGILGKVESPFVDVVAQSILGDEQFVDEVTRNRLLGRAADRREEPSLRNLQGGLTPDKVLRAVSEEFAVDISKLTRRAGGNRLARRIAVFCVSELCRSRFSQTDLAGRFGLGLGGFGTAHRQVELALSEAPALAKRVDAIKTRLI